MTPKKHPPSIRAMRGSLDSKLLIIVIAVYFGLVCIMGFSPDILSAPIAADSVFTVGIILASIIMLVIVVLTLVYAGLDKSNQEGE